MTILTFTWRKNENNVQEIKENYNVTTLQRLQLINPKKVLQN